MSGVFYNGEWYENTGFVCRRCGNPVYESNLREYSYQCFHHDEDLFTIEVDKAKNPPRIIVARPFDGVTINTALEYLLDDKNELLIFNNQHEAEAYLLARGVPGEDLQFLHFIDYDGLPPEDAPD